jgi:uncharacterized tellurite resistance protein B-like protein
MRGPARNGANSSAVTFDEIRNAQSEPVNLRPGGLFYGLSALFRPGMNRQTAFFALLAAAVAVDGRASPEESEEFTALSHRTKTLSKLDADTLERIKSAVAPRLDRGKLPALIDHAAKSLPRKMRLSAFGHACDIIFADRVVLQSERDYLKRLVEALSIAQDEAESMLRAIRAKNLH